MADTTVNENAGSPFTYTVNSFGTDANGNPNPTFDVTVTTTDGTAVNGKDFKASPTTLHFVNPSITKLSEPISIIDDNIFEGPESFVINATGADPLTVHILDNDPIPTATVGNAPTLQGTQASSGSLVFPVTLSNPSAFPITINWSTTASPDVQTTSGSVTIPATTDASKPNTTGSISVPVTVIEDETVSISFSVAPGSQAIASGSATGMIDDLGGQPPNSGGNPGQTKTPPGQGGKNLTPGPVPPGQIKVPPGQIGKNPHLIVGDDKANSLPGTDQTDTINGKGGDDVIDGRGGDDIIDGGTGNDIIIGGLGNDLITGGDGKDVFIYNQGDGKDHILDFTQGSDRMSLNETIGGNHIDTFAELQGLIASKAIDMSTNKFGVVLTFGGGDSLIIDGMHSIAIADWEFH